MTNHTDVYQRQKVHSGAVSPDVDNMLKITSDGRKLGLDQRIINPMLQMCIRDRYQLYMKSGVPKSTIGNLVNCAYPSMKLRIIHELCQGLEMEKPSLL